MKIYNTLTRAVEEFVPIQSGKVGMYNCGPTVYDYLTIGNWRAYVFVDTLKRALLYLGYDVKQVMNVTDVGHLTSDEDFGEDKLEKGARREQKSVWDVAQLYLDDFIASREAMNILPPDVLCRATDHIPEQIEMIKTLVDKGYAYVTPEAVYFDVTKFPDYTKLSGQKLEDKEVGVREDLVVDPGKRHPQDFRLWQLDRPDHQMLWDSPWGKGFPGWHIECSAMSTHYLGQPFDIHTGGVDHIPVHHTNEISQSEAASGVKFVNYWMHNEFLTIDGGRMGKSLGNGYTLHDIREFLKEHLGFESRNALMALRYLYLTSHYRNKLDFTKQSLFASFTALSELYREVAELYDKVMSTGGKNQVMAWLENKNNKIIRNTEMSLSGNGNAYEQKLVESLENDIDTPSIMAALHTLLHDASLTDIEKVLLVAEYDKALGLRIMETVSSYMREFTPEITSLIEKRTSARMEKDYALSDSLRKELEGFGIDVLDKKDNSVYYRK